MSEGIRGPAPNLNLEPVVLMFLPHYSHPHWAGGSDHFHRWSPRRFLPWGPFMNQSWNHVIRYFLSFVVLILFGGTPTVCASAKLSPSMSYVPFGNVLIGKTTSYRVLFTNTGNRTLKISGLNTVGQNFKASSLPLPYTLAPGQSFSVNVAFTPMKAGTFSGNVAVISNATNLPRTGVSGTGVTPSSLSIIPGGVNFGDVPGSVENTQTVQSFSVNSGNVPVISNATNLPSTRVSGTGVTPTRLSVIPGWVNFGDVPVGVANTQTVTLLNKGQSNVRVAQVSATGAGFSVYGLTLPFSIAPGRSSAFTLRFAPTKTGSTNGAITIASNALTTPLTASLAGNGVSSSTNLTTDATSLNFGGVTVGHPAMKTLKLTNKGNARITVKGIKVSGSQFSASGYAVPFALAAGQSASFMVQFAPRVPGGATGNVLITSTASNPADNVSLWGSGTPPGLHSVVLTWNPSSSMVVGYNVYRSASNSGPFDRLSSSVVPGTTYTDLTVQAGTKYFYVATAVDAIGIESMFSNEISVAIP